MKPLLKTSSINFCSPHCVFFKLRYLMYSEALEKHWRWVLVAWRFCQLSRADCLSGKHLSDLIILDLIAIWQLWGMERLSLWCGGLFFCLLILGIFYLAIPQGVDDPPLLRAAIVVKKKNWIRPALSTREFPMNLGGWFSLFFFWKLHSAPGLLPCNSISLLFGEEAQKTGEIWWRKLCKALISFLGCGDLIVVVWKCLDLLS